MTVALVVNESNVLVTLVKNIAIGQKRGHLIIEQLLSMSSSGKVYQSKPWSMPLVMA